MIQLGTLGLAWAITASAFAEEHLTVEAENPTLDQDVVPLVSDATRRAGDVAAVWGALRAPTRVVIVSNIDSLEIRAHAEGSDWLQGVAAYDVIWLLSPHQMSAAHQIPSLRYLTTLLTHELTHCVMQQASGSKDDYQSRGFPFWFTEGMATNTSGEAAALSREALAAELSRRLTADPMHDGRALAHGEPNLAYSSAFWAFSLLSTRGRAPVLQVLAAMRAGLGFPQAFATVYGESLEDFDGKILTALRRNTPLPSR